VVLNVTVVAPAAAGFVTVFAGGSARPVVSNLNFVTAQTVPNLVVAPVGAGGKVALFNGSRGSIQLVADVSGYYLDTATPPGPVTGVTATAGSSTIALTWVNPSGASLTGVMIRRSLGSQIPASPISGSLVADVTKPTATFTDAGLESGTKYSYALFAHDAGPVYAAGAPVSATTTTTTSAPGPVTGVRATAGSSTIALTWVNPSGASLTGVMIRRSLGSQVPTGPTAGSLVADVSKPTATFTDPGLDSGTKYSYALFAHDAGPVYATGAPVSATTTTTTSAPGPVTGPTAGSDNTSITLSWVNPSDASLTGVMIRRSLGSLVPSGPASGSLVADVSKPIATFSDTGLEPGTKYSYALFAHDAGPVYAAGATVSATTTNTGGPSISGTVTDAGGTHRGLNMVDVDVISLGTGGGFSTSTLDDGTWSVTGLPAGTYSVCFNGSIAEGGSSDATGYVNQCYKDQPTARTANPVTVKVGSTAVGIDAALVGATR